MKMGFCSPLLALAKICYLFVSRDLYHLYSAVGIIKVAFMR